MASVDFFHPEFRSKRKGLPDMLRYESCRRPGVVVGKGGELISTFKYRGPDMQCASIAEITYLRKRVNEMLNKLGHGWMIHSTTVRTESVEYDDNGHFPDAVTRAIENERVEQYRTEGTHFENDYFITFTYLPDPLTVSKVKSFAFDAAEPGSRGTAHLVAKTYEYFERMLAEYTGMLETGMQTKLHRLMPRRELDPVTLRPIWYEDQLAFFHECLTGKTQPIRVPNDCPATGVDYAIGSYSFVSGIKPRIDKTCIRVLAIEGLPDEGTHFGVLEALNSLPVKFRWTTRWIVRDREAAKASTRRIRGKWRQKIRGFMADLTGKKGGAPNQDAADMAADAEAVLNDLESGLVSYGYWASTVVLMHEDAEYLESAVRYLEKHIGAIGYPVRDEDVNCVEAYFGSLPGHGYENLREPEIHSMNVADCLPLTSTWQGPTSNPCSFYQKFYPNGPVPPLFQGAASGGTPFRVVLHNGDVGHTLVLGPTGAGKSTILGLMAAQHFRYPSARLWAFEKGESLLGLCLGARGTHYAFMDDDAPASKHIGFAPFLHIDRTGDKTWAKDYALSILELNGVKVDQDVTADVRRAIEMLATRPAEMRSFTEFNQLIQTREAKAVFATYESEMAGGMLNHRRDSISGGRFTVFEMEKLMEMNNKHVAPVLMYLFRMIERSLDGSPTMIILDEAWLMLAHELFAERLKAWFKVLRKANAHVVFATQELQDVDDSPIASTIFSACQTKILLPNPAAASEDNAKLYKAIGLTDREIDLLVNSTLKRDYFFTSPAGRRKFQLELGPVALAFVGASGVDDRKTIKELHSLHGDGWVRHWLIQRGLNPDGVLNDQQFRRAA